jgi:hypothetical protein
MSDDVDSISPPHSQFSINPFVRPHLLVDVVDLSCAQPFIDYEGYNVYSITIYFITTALSSMSFISPVVVGCV